MKKAAKKTAKKKKAAKNTGRPVRKAAKKKTPAKKKAAKPRTKTTSRKTKNAKAVPMVADESQAFWVNNGDVLKSLADLEKALGHMTVVQFEYHANGYNNDFANWTEFVLLDKACAASLRNARTKDEARKIVRQYLKRYA